MNERLQQKILSNIVKDENSECWIWKGQVSNSGYGKIKIKDEVYGTKTEGAQEVSYMAFIEPITQGAIIRQNCNNRLCVNPEHLIAHKA
ncbi:MAG: hypothetical protein OQK98_12075 [Gammaproteobacteria bacterium]|nr:hypothetical protein [Gammaproteobacteria bacterium]